MKKTIDHLQIHEGDMQKHHEAAIKKHKNLVPYTKGADMTKYGAAIIGKESATFSKNLTSEQKRDFIMSKIFAQLHAEYATKDKKEGESGKEWYKAYGLCLEHLGYAIDGFSFGRLQSSKTNASISDAAIDALIAAAIFTIPGAEIAAGNAVRKSLSAIKAVDESDDNKTTFFSRSAGHAGEVKFQISAGSANEAGNLSAVLGAYHTTNSTENDNILWVSWQSNNQSVWYSSQMIELDSQIFSYLRTSILKRVEKYLLKYVQLMPIEDENVDGFALK